MASLTLKTPDGKVKAVTLIKPLTIIGRGAGNDIPLEDPRLPETALLVHRDKQGFLLRSAGTTDFTVNGKRKAEHLLTPADVVKVAGTEISFSREDAPRALPALAGAGGTADPDAHTSEVTGVLAREHSFLARLVDFSNQLAGVYDVARVLEALMDEAIALTRADKGFLLLLEGADPRVRVARNLDRENLEEGLERLSDSIVRKVFQTGQPVILSNALDDPEFKSSESVVNLRLLSVMCVPLKHKGELMGLIYVGNDKLRDRFEPRARDMLMVLAAQASLVIKNAILVNELMVDNRALRTRLEDHRFGDLIGSCDGMREVFKKIEKVSQADITVLITGESGTGKELIAREIHRRSPRASGPFVAINCGAIPENLLESELFGHVKGAFTGAVAARQGKFQAAIGGTLFLDEVGDMPAALQVKLLRALQEKVVYRVGENRPEPVNIRVLAATHRTLENEVKRGTFREDLYYRINTVTLHLPALRDRGEDVELVATYLLRKFSAEFNPRVTAFRPDALRAFRRHQWPGNIRELENRIKKALVMADGVQLTARDLDLEPESIEPVVPLDQALENFRRSYIDKALRQNDNNRTKTAEDLGVNPRTIFRHLEKLEAERRGEPTIPADGAEYDEDGDAP